MTKLTVAEASRRGYATSLSILQAVQKSWLSAEKDSDGQMRVDAGDLERLFGRPISPTPAVSGLASAESPPVYAAHGAMRETDAYNGGAADDSFDGGAPDIAEADEDEDGPDPDEGWGTPPSWTASADKTDNRDEHAALRAEVARLQQDLAAERRRTAALLDVLAGRLVPVLAQAAPSPEVEADSARETGLSAAISVVPEPGEAVEVVDAKDAEDANSEGAANEDAAVEAADVEVVDVGDVDIGVVDVGVVDVESPGDADTGDDTAERAARVYNTPTPDAEFIAGAVARPEAETVAPGASGSEDSLPASDDIAMPVLTASPHSRPFQPSQARRAPAVPAAASSSFFWQIWILVAFVWIVLIGAFFWYATDLGGDLWIIAQWIRGERVADTPEFAAATNAALRAARDILGPPAALLVAMLAARALLRAFRR